MVPINLSCSTYIRSPKFKEHLLVIILFYLAPLEEKLISCGYKAQRLTFEGS